MGHEKSWRGGRSANQTPFAAMDLLSPHSPTPGVEGKSRLGGELRREKQRCLGRGSARIGTGQSTTCARGFFACFFPLAPARPESHRSIGQAGPVATSAN
jgi:hypothetical protein